MRTNPGLIDIGVASSGFVETVFENPRKTKKYFTFQQKESSIFACILCKIVFVKGSLDVLRGLNAECADTVQDAVLCFDKIIHGESCDGHNLSDLKETFK